jgi:hypothetical protein
MIKINLEKELLAENKKIITAKELLFVQEYERVVEVFNDDSLNRIGVTESIDEGYWIKRKNESLKKEAEDFDKSRVFHISQIESICNKYYLKFLPSSRYKGALDNDLPFKINNFEASYGVKCESRNDYGNTFIIAPPESFNLQEKPLDPLLFYKINEEYFYLIHKWGNDLNITRRLYGILQNINIIVCIIFISGFIGYLLPFGNIGIWFAITLVVSTFSICLYFLISDREYILWAGLIRKINFRSPYEND